MPEQLFGIHKILFEIEQKVDACLILLREITTSDDFVYTKTGKSKEWLQAIREAEDLANHVIETARESRPTYALASSGWGLETDLSDREPSGKGACYEPEVDHLAEEASPNGREQK